ncbi:hypothetical protein A9K97_gp429 [Tokyovirus A1]|uniref:hypothetical protein n=1 Tax=Tokyovirus A1 TaxID=1826170 RepID=UPI0007A96518|nr:hypothetical protein A9K97_gp429 [Tokyovirus A1]BAU79922.1 hypothetical protein [Tokyovirus A1]
MGHVYLISRPSFAEGVVKIGKSESIKSRLSAYGSQAVWYRVCSVGNCNEVERKLIECFTEKFALVEGREFFSVSSIKDAMKIFDEVVADTDFTQSMGDDSLVKTPQNSSVKTFIDGFMGEFSTENYTAFENGWIMASDIYENFVEWSKQKGNSHHAHNSVFGKMTNSLFDKQRMTLNGKKHICWKLPSNKNAEQVQKARSNCSWKNLTHLNMRQIKMGGFHQQTSILILLVGLSKMATKTLQMQMCSGEAPTLSLKRKEKHRKERKYRFGKSESAIPKRKT